MDRYEMAAIGGGDVTARLHRLLTYLEQDTGNLLLRKDAIREACGARQWEIARQLIEVGLQAHPAECADLRVLHARCLQHLRNIDAAIAECTAILATAPDDAEGNGLLALLLHDQGMNEHAGQYAERALKSDVRQLDAQLTVASIEYLRGEYATARYSYEALLQIHPGCGRAWLGLALIDLLYLNLDAARRHIDLACTHMPEHIGSWHVLAWLALMRNDFAGARAAFERALAIDRNFGETYGGLAIVAVLQDRQANAQANIKRALRLDRSSMSARYAELLILKSTGRFDAATAGLRDLLAEPTRDGRTRYRDLIEAHIEFLRGARPGLVPAVLH